MAVATLHHLARACHDRFRSKRTRQMIRDTEFGHHRALAAFEDSEKLVEGSARLAWLELDEECRDLIAQRGENPEILLRWLDMYPKTLLEIVLSPKTAEKSPEPATTP